MERCLLFRFEGPLSGRKRRAWDSTILEDAVALLALVAGQGVEPAEDSDGTDGRWRIARQVAPDRVISSLDPDACHEHNCRQKKSTVTKPTSMPSPTPGW